MSRNSVAVGLLVLKDWLTLDSEPLSVSSRLRARVRLLPINPGIVAVSIPITGLLPAPPVATGLKLTELNPSVLAIRNSAPPLNVCLDFVQLTESAYVHMGLCVPTLLQVP